MNTLQLSIVHRLPQSYRWSAGFAGSKVEPIPQNVAGCENCLVALKLLSPSDENAWRVMERLSQALTDIEVDSSVLECEGEPCLFVKSRGRVCCHLPPEKFWRCYCRAFLRPVSILSASLTTTAGACSAALAR